MYGEIGVDMAMERRFLRETPQNLNIERELLNYQFP